MKSVRAPRPDSAGRVQVACKPSAQRTVIARARDAINNVEGVFIPANTLAAGRKLRIRMTGQNVPIGPQRFAIYAYNVRPTN